MVCERGCQGSGEHFRHVIATLWSRPQAQVDWGAFGHLDIGAARRPLIDLNAQARRWPEDHRRSVREAFRAEREVRCENEQSPV